MVSDIEPAVTHAGSQAPFRPPQLFQVVSQAPLPPLPYSIFVLEDHKSKKVLAFSLTKFLNVRAPLVINSDTGFLSSWRRDCFSNGVMDS